MNEFGFSVWDAVFALPGALMAGWVIGAILWAIQFVVVDLPNKVK